jgi:hypothetical protein
MIAWVQRILSFKSPSDQLAVIEQEEPSLEQRLDRLLRNLGGYNKRTADDLREIMDDLDAILNIVEKIILTLENIGGAERARNLRSRLRNNRTRAQKAYEQQRAA